MLLVTLFLLFFAFAGTSKPGDDAVREKELDKLGYEALAQLHKSMDEDASGTIDFKETDEFLRDELHVKDKDPITRRTKTFHHNDDDSITVDDLWSRWVSSEERKWSVDDVVDWLTRSVELPQYVDIFKENNINGSNLPRLAIQNMSYLQHVLHIPNAVHRQKLQLKAMDAVLFGYRGAKPSYLKDILLIALLVVAVGAYWFAMFQRKASQKQAEALTSQLGKLKDMEQEFVDLQNKLEEERCRQESSKASVEDEEIENKEELLSLKCQLQEAERLREQRHPLLQSLLRKTYEIELSRINQQKLDSLKEMNEARELVEKLRKKQSSLLNQIRSVHGSETEEIDERIVSVRQKMEKTSRSIEECEQRWLEIEYLMGFKITNSTIASGARVAPGGGLASVAGFARPHFYATGSLEMENDIGDAGDSRNQFGESIFRASYNMQHQRQQPSGINLAHRTMTKSHATSSTTGSGNATASLLHSDTTTQLYRPKFNVSGSDILRSASASDLVASGNQSPASGGGSPINELGHRSKTGPTLAQIGKKGSQISMGTTVSETPNTNAAAANPVKSKKKILNIFGGNRDKKE